MSENLKDQIIWNEFRKGNMEALELIYKENYSPLYYYGIKFVPDTDLIKDLIQELFVELIDSGLHLSNTDNIRFYLLKALRNKLTRHLSRFSKHSLSDFQSHEFCFLDSVENFMIKKEVESEIRNQIIISVKKLTDKQQEIIYHRFYNDLSYREIAELFNVEIQTVRNLMSRAIKSLKEDLNEEACKNLILTFILYRYPE